MKDLDLLTDEELLRLSPYTIEELEASERLGKCPIIPHRREQEFLDLEAEEVLFGGAVGGGKTEAGMLWLADGVQHSNFSGLFLRRTFSQLQGSPTSPIERSYKFFSQMGGRFSGSGWKFPNGAVVRFGHMQYENDKHSYDGHEFHRIFFDQVEQFSETQYTYMFSRLRRIVGFELPCGIRSSANPVGGHWVRQRFVSQQAIDELKKYTANDPSPPGMKFECPGTEGYFLPSRIADNPSLEVDEYIARLRTRLGAVLAAKLANGDWSAIEGAVVDQDDLRYYTQRGEILTVMTGERNLSKDSRTMRRIATIDTAGTSQQKANEQRGKPPSWSVCAIWDYWPEVGLFLRHIWRKRAGWHDLRSGVKATLDNWGKPQVYIENAHHGPPLAAEIPGAKLVSTAISRGSNVKTNAKYDRAVASGLLGWITDHKLYLPDPATVAGTADWMPEFEAELLSWTGHPDETADQIDVCSHAVHQVRSTGKSWGGVVKTKKARVGAKRW